jgi:hypothetical protein
MHCTTRARFFSTSDGFGFTKRLFCYPVGLAKTPKNTMLPMLRIVALSSALVLASVSFNACGNGHAQTRFVAASPDAPGVDFLVDGAILASNLVFPSTNNAYLTVTSGNRPVEVRQTGTTTDLVDASNVDFINHDQYTLFFTGLTKANPPNQTVNQVPDDNTPPASGKTKLRFFHASPGGPGHVDIYVIAPGTPITNLSPSIGALAYQQASMYLNVAAATYEIIVTAVGSKTSVVDQTPPTFTAGQIRTFAVIDPPPAGCNSMTLCMLELADLN